MHFVLPSSILEEELASTKRILEEKKMEEDYVKGYIKKGDEFSTSPFGSMTEFSPDHHIHQTTDAAASATTDLTTATTKAARRSRRQPKPKNIFGTSPDSVSSDLTHPPVSTSKSKKKNQSSTTATSSSLSSSSSSSSAASKRINEENLTSNIGDEEEEDIDESLLEPEELLRRARSRLLEDLSEGGEDGMNGGGGSGGLHGEKGVLTLPHSLGKYKEVRIRERESGKANKQQYCIKHIIQFSSNRYLFSFNYRFTTKMVASEYTLQPNELPSFTNLMPNVPVAYGTRRFGTIVVKIWQIDVCV